ncbi:MAG TPA: hypothetical protein VJY62_02450 [Bacteroidia bacterium]|nr:hypothetical protein [Bacteroidia bacterium]
MIDLIIELEGKGLLMRCVKAGIISTKYIAWKEIYTKYQAELTATGNKADAIYNTSGVCRISEKTVRRVIASMEVKD